jgi:hypothetical protein
MTRLDALRAAGITLALDDFGTGYSSLSYLHRFPIQILKIDRSFVSGMDDDPERTSILTAIVALANGLGLSIVAEGIEHEPQARQLDSLHCEYGQGFHLGRPMPADALDALIDEAPRSPEHEQLLLAATQGGGECSARFLHALRAEPGQAAPEQRAAERVEVVEADNARLGHPVVGPEGQLAAHAPHGTSAGSHDDGADAVGNRITGEHQYRAIPARCGRPPDFAPHHAGVPTQASGESAKASSSSVRGSRS